MNKHISDILSQSLTSEEIHTGIDEVLWEDSHCECGVELSRRSYNFHRNRCYKCEYEAKEKAKSDWLNSQKELTIEERLGKIEEFIYWYHNTDHRDPLHIPMR